MSSSEGTPVEKVVCRVCEDVDAEVVSKGLCSRCYQREYRGKPEAPIRERSPKGEGTLIQLRASRATKAMVEQMAQMENVPVAVWIRQAIDEKAERQLAALSGEKPKR